MALKKKIEKQVKKKRKKVFQKRKLENWKRNTD